MKAPSGVASKPERAFPPAVGCGVTRWAPVRGGPPGTGLALAALGVQGTPADEVCHPPRPAGAAARAKGPWKVRAPVLGRAAGLGRLPHVLLPLPHPGSWLFF